MMAPASGCGPLAGIKVLDLCTFINGPAATCQMAEQGADVIKVEPGDGEAMRHTSGVPGVLFTGWEMFNRGKRSLTLDLKHPGAATVMKRLVEWADVLAENFRPGVLERLGFGYDVCKKWNPSIIYASNSGFGHAGEWAERPSYDGMAQAFTGVLTHNGGGPSHAPREIGWTFSDVVGANAFVNAILMALVHRERTGKGQLVLCSQAGATLYFQRQEVATALNNFAGRQRDDGRRPWERFVFQQVHKASDGRWVCFSVTKKEQLKRLVEDALERPDLLTAEVISRWPSPKRDVAAKFRQDICNIIAKNTSAHWISRMVASNVPCAPVSTYGELGSPSRALEST